MLSEINKVNLNWIIIMMEKIIEVFHFAMLMQINPEGQPGVEKAKKLI